MESDSISHKDTVTDTMKFTVKLLLIPVGCAICLIVIGFMDSNRLPIQFALGKMEDTDRPGSIERLEQERIANNINSDNFNSNHGLTETASPEPIQLILLTYMRSGSSFTGDLLQQHPSVFYVYEPLWGLHYMYNHNTEQSRKLQFMDNSTQKVPGSEEELNMQSLKVVDDYLKCRLEDIDVFSLTQGHMIRSHTTTDFYYCAGQHQSHFHQFVRCLKPMIDKCERSTVKLVKVIRLTMQKVSILMNANPSLKVIHLIRDPRGTLRSQRRVSKFKSGEEEMAAHTLCRQIEEDIGVSRTLSKKFPDRILTVRYEDIVDSPVEATREMYTFLKLNVSPVIEAYIWNITYAGHPDDCVICTTRTNSSQTAYRWRQQLPFYTIETVQNQCAQVFRIMGYKMFNNEEDMKNENISPKYDVYSQDLMKVEVSKRTSGFLHK